MEVSGLKQPRCSSRLRLNQMSMVASNDATKVWTRGSSWTSKAQSSCSGKVISYSSQFRRGGRKVAGLRRCLGKRAVNDFGSTSTRVNPAACINLRSSS